jgi:hypothetical protein
MSSSTLIDEYSLLCGLECEGVRGAAILAKVERAAWDHVRADAGALPELPCGDRIESVVGRFIGDDDQEVPIARRRRAPAGPAPEQPDLFWAPKIEDTGEERGDGSQVDRPPLEIDGAGPNSGLSEAIGSIFRGHPGTLIRNR